MNTIPLIAVYLHLRMYGFEAITPITSDTMLHSLLYYTRRGDITYSSTITPQIMTIGYTPIEENVEIDESEES